MRRATKCDIDECNALCVRVHGHDRRAELVEAIERERATVVEHADRLTGYATGLGFSGHVVGEGNVALRALIGAAPEFSGPGLLYNEPQGAFLPSIVYGKDRWNPSGA